MTAAAHAGDYPFSVERIKLDGGEGILAVNDGPLTVSATSISPLARSTLLLDRTWPASFELKPYSSKTLGVVQFGQRGRALPRAFVDHQDDQPRQRWMLPAGLNRRPDSAQEVREDARSELQKMLEPVKHLPRWFDTNKIGSSFISEGLFPLSRLSGAAHHPVRSARLHRLIQRKRLTAAIEMLKPPRPGSCFGSSTRPCRICTCPLREIRHAGANIDHSCIRADSLLVDGSMKRSRAKATTIHASDIRTNTHGTPSGFTLDDMFEYRCLPFP